MQLFIKKALRELQAGGSLNLICGKNGITFFTYSGTIFNSLSLLGQKDELEILVSSIPPD
jgi:hypothetical protein